MCLFSCLVPHYFALNWNSIACVSSYFMLFPYAVAFILLKVKPEGIMQSIRYNLPGNDKPNILFMFNLSSDAFSVWRTRFDIIFNRHGKRNWPFSMFHVFLFFVYHYRVWQSSDFATKPHTFIRDISFILLQLHISETNERRGKKGNINNRKRTDFSLIHFFFLSLSYCLPFWTNNNYKLN